jgi:hypothetical protein
VQQASERGGRGGRLVCSPAESHTAAGSLGRLQGLCLAVWRYLPFACTCVWLWKREAHKGGIIIERAR